MILINLFITFLKIGLLNFGGGNGIAAIINNEIINNKQWITKEEFVNMITISRITPGPIATNIATYVGMKTAGISGAIIATVALITAPIIIMVMLLLILHKINFLNYCLEKLNPIIVALWIITIIILIENTYLKIENDKTEFLKTLTIAGINFFILFFYNKISPALIIILSGFFYTLI
ncbi:chromate transporter [Borreliella tanukii]|uniref:chromate transporter n=1 Tax=Borreliella tanukii TaxID=56146 RepID=UPI00264977BC|nr:chromate transporter [Borreliella tanukii]WKC79840.1 chromate transporter [Borreliella tanukii]WKC80758.1 chromate transporter [Borreliella tanukii]WKC81674.1 chromate transporter [Borreliella tanukii]WKC82591.1 chromate transporter [Borreliella tanukii]